MKTMIWRVALLVVAVAMFLSACGPAATEVPAEPAAPAEPTGSFLDRAFAGEFKGTVVTMAGPFVDSDAVKFEQSVKSFEDKTGIDIQYSGSKEFEASISISIDGGNPPDIADFPQPGLLDTQVKKGKVAALKLWSRENVLS